MLKTIAWVVGIVVAVIVLWRVFDKDKRVSRALENTVENATLSVEERSLPAKKSGTSRNAIIRKAMLKQREKDNREWTAANRAAHPDLYLEHCETTFNDFLNQYDAAIIEVKTTTNLYQREIATAREDSVPLMGFLKEAKQVLSDSKRRYPAKVGVFTYKDADQLKSAVFATDEKLTEQEQTIQQRTQQLEQLNVTLDDLEKGRDRVKNELKDLARIKAQAKTEMLQKSVNGLHERMNELLSGVDTIANESNATPGQVRKTTEKSVDDVFSRRGID